VIFNGRNWFYVGRSFSAYLNDLLTVQMVLTLVNAKLKYRIVDDFC